MKDSLFQQFFGRHISGDLVTQNSSTHPTLSPLVLLCHRTISVPSVTVRFGASAHSGWPVGHEITYVVWLFLSLHARSARPHVCVIRIGSSTYVVQN